LILIIRDAGELVLRNTMQSGVDRSAREGDRE
jgi:hypothetical protein